MLQEPLTYLDDRTWRSHVDAALYADLQPYTEDSIYAVTAFPFYNDWKRVVIEKGGDEGFRWLTHQKEHKIG